MDGAERAGSLIAEEPRSGRTEVLRAELVEAAARRIRSALDGIEGNLPLLRAAIPEEAAEAGALAEVEAGTRTLCEHVDAFLEYAEGEARAAREGRPLARLAVKDLFRKALGLVAETARTRRILISERLPEGLPLVLGDAERLRRALVHVLARLLRASEDGAVLSIEGRALPEKGITVRLSADCGPGIRAWELDLLIARQVLLDQGGDLRFLPPRTLELTLEN